MKTLTLVIPAYREAARWPEEAYRSAPHPDVAGSTLTWKSTFRILRELWRIGVLTHFGRK